MRLASGFRFRPLPGEISAAERWALIRAFGPRDARAPAVEAEAAWELAAALDLAPRIGARASVSRLTAELGEGAAERFVAARRFTASTALRYEQLAADVARLAAERGIAVVFLKGMALQLAGYCPPGERSMGDLDCLARRVEARTLWNALVERGFTAAEAPANDQHLPPLAAPVWGAVDLHFALRGVWHRGGEWWSADRLLAEELVRPAPGMPGAYVPQRDVLAAHALVHGLDQHGLAPGRHGLLRLIGDLASLLPSDEDRGRFLLAAGGWISPSISPQETAAALALARALAAGDVPAGAALTDLPGRLLLHFLAAATDESYGASGRRRNLWLRLRRAAEAGGLLRYIGRKLHRPG